MSTYPRTAEEIIRAGQIGECHIRELLDLAREMGIKGLTDRKPAMLKLVITRAKELGWL